MGIRMMSVMRFFLALVRVGRKREACQRILDAAAPNSAHLPQGCGVVPQGNGR
jgi:hypothetical protein